MRAPGLVAAVMVTVCAAGCGGDARPSSVRAAGAYSALVSWAIGTLPPARPASEPLVFVLARRPPAIPLDVEAAVVHQLDGKVSVRFVDDRAEAVDTGAVLDPVRRDGLLVTTPAVPAGAESADLAVTLYRRVDLARSYRITLRRQAQSWTVTGAQPAPGPA